jgi:CRISPR-associated exonuclease Cas4
MHLPPGAFTTPAAIENRQTVQVFSEEQLRLESAFRPVRWIRPSDGDPDVVPIQLPTPLNEHEPIEVSAEIEGSRVRGIILHKLMEELLTGELAGSLGAVQDRARLLRDQLAASAAPSGSPDPAEVASTALRTLAIPELQPFLDQLIPEVPIYGALWQDMDELTAGRADAVAVLEHGQKVVFDWKSDVAPKDAERATYSRQLGQYLHAIGAQRGGIVYMSSGRIDWIIAPS